MCIIYTYICIYMYNVCVCVCVCIYIYIYIYMKNKAWHGNRVISSLSKEVILTDP